jgi:hypothetical protein
VVYFRNHNRLQGSVWKEGLPPLLNDIFEFGSTRSSGGKPTFPTEPCQRSRLLRIAIHDSEITKDA